MKDYIERNRVVLGLTEAGGLKISGLSGILSKVKASLCKLEPIYLKQNSVVERLLRV